MDTNGHEPSEHDALPFEFGFLKVDDKADAEFGDPKIVQHLAAFEISDPIDHLRIDHNGVLYDQIGNEFGYADTFVNHIEAALLVDPEVLQPKFHDERILVRMLMKAVSHFTQNFKGATNDGINQLTVDELAAFVSIRVHSWLNQSGIVEQALAAAFAAEAAFLVSTKR
jgi:hypothetical protein